MQTTGPTSAPNGPTQSWHTLQPQDILAKFGVEAEAGLGEAEISQQQQQHGPNELIERGAKSPWRMLWEQATAVMILVLLGAAGIKGLVAFVEGKPREWIDAGAILLVVILNVILGFTQEYRAEKAMAALKKLAAPLVRVRRNRRVHDIPARELVPGDIVLLEAGNAVPADLRLLESANLRAQEASLTGESLPVDKHPTTRSEVDLPLGDRTNMLYLGTAISYGRGTGVVVATGMQTELGRIAELLQGVGTEQTPLQKRIAQLGGFLALSMLVVVAVMFLFGLARGESPLDMFLAAVAVAVAAIPEGLPAVMTITLALGAQRMLKRRALIRQLPAVETLGSVTTICSDKTGTLTENKMQVTVLDVAGHTADLSEVVHRGYPVLDAAEHPEPLEAPALSLLLSAATLCNDAVLQPHDAREHVAVGDPTEGAILVAAAHHGLWKMHLEGRYPRIAEAPFSSERKRMTTVHRLDDTNVSNGTSKPPLHTLPQSPFVAFTKGAADTMIEVSSCAFVDGVEQPMTEDLRQRVREATNRLAGQGLRLLGVGYRTLSAVPLEGSVEHLEQNMTFIGLIGMIDPPRPEVRVAVTTCQQAGIRPVMITGDHPLTALEIARQLGIVSHNNGHVLTGQDLSVLTPDQLRAVVENVSVYARVSPEHKLNIVQALQEKGHVVAMTGDGVNDAPALRKSDIGVAMGVTGTDVSKEAANMVILDDNFATIVHAVEEGRTIYDNVRKFVKYIVTSNSAEVTVMFLSQAFGMPLPMTTLQILWMNLVTDGVPGLALGLEPTEKDAMRRAAFAPNESIFSRGIGRHIIVIGILLAAVSFGVGYGAYVHYGPTGPWGTMVFMTLTLSQLGHALAVRSNRESLFTIGIRSNPTLLWAVCLTLALQLTVVYVPALQDFFQTQALTVRQLVSCLVASTVVFWAVEVEKWLLRRTAPTL
jgi:P-type Ca2+ transporter type 2C